MSYTTYGDDSYQSKYTFWLRDAKYVDSGQMDLYCVFTPVYFPLAGDTLRTAGPEREPHPLGTKEDNYHTGTSEDPLIPPGPLRQLLLSCIPAISLIVIFNLLWEIVGEVFVINALTLKVEVTAIKRKSRLLHLFYRNLSDSDVVEYLERNINIPQQPESVPAPCSRPLKQKPALPKLVQPVMPEPPAEYLLDGPEGDYSRTLKGAVIYTAEESRRLARHAVFADNQVRPYFCFGDLPIPFYDGESPHALLMGTTGSGKTTLMRMLMSATLPLTRSQAERIVRQSPDIRQRKPDSSHEWSRSFTHQAVVYDAKNEAIPLLKAFGFNEESDLIILDPSNPNCFAWDIASDINDPDSVTHLAQLIVPTQKGGQQSKESEFWEAEARFLIEDVVIAFRNAAFATGKEPSWTLRDLVNALSTEECLRSVLKYHDVPDEVVEKFRYAPGQLTSILMSARHHVRKFSRTAQRWVEAERQGRKISFKWWAINCPHTVLVLPNTENNVDVNGPLNQLFVKALTNIFLQRQYSSFTDNNGAWHVRKRYVYLDEVSHLGRTEDLRRLMTEGRSSGVHVVLGVHQLSDLQETYGEAGAKGILGLCSYLALLKTGDPDTADWMSKRIGDRLQAYDTKSFTYGSQNSQAIARQESSTTSQAVGSNQSNSKAVTDGQSDSTGKSTGHVSNSTKGGPPSSSRQTGTNESHCDNHSEQTTEASGSSIVDTNGSTEGTTTTSNTGTNESTTRRQELREERTVSPAYFLNLPNPVTAKAICGCFIVPSIPVWKAEIFFESLRPRYEFPEALNELHIVTWEDDENISKRTPWNDEDYKRLGLSKTLPLPKPENSDDDTLPDDFDF